MKGVSSILDFNYSLVVKSIWSISPHGSTELFKCDPTQVSGISATEIPERALVCIPLSGMPLVWFG